MVEGAATATDLGWQGNSESYPFVDLSLCMSRHNSKASVLNVKIQKRATVTEQPLPLIPSAPVELLCVLY